MNWKSKLKALYLFLTLSGDYGYVVATHVSTFWLVTYCLFCGFYAAAVVWLGVVYILPLPFGFLIYVFVYIPLIFWSLALLLQLGTRANRSGRFNL